MLCLVVPYTQNISFGEQGADELFTLNHQCKTEER
jgi:hypothetical protein